MGEAKRLELCVLLEAPDQMQLQVRQADAAALAAVYEAFRWPHELWWQVGSPSRDTSGSKFLAGGGPEGIPLAGRVLVARAEAAGPLFW